MDTTVCFVVAVVGGVVWPLQPPSAVLSCTCFCRYSQGSSSTAASFIVGRVLISATEITDNEEDCFFVPASVSPFSRSLLTSLSDRLHALGVFSFPKVRVCVAVFWYNKGELHPMWLPTRLYFLSCCVTSRVHCMNCEPCASSCFVTGSPHLWMTCKMVP